MNVNFRVYFNKSEELQLPHDGRPVTVSSTGMAASVNVHSLSAVVKKLEAEGYTISGVVEDNGGSDFD